MSIAFLSDKLLPWTAGRAVAWVQAGRAAEQLSGMRHTCVTASGPCRLTSSTRLHSSRGTNSTGATRPTPALLTSKLRPPPPSCCWTCCLASAMLASLHHAPQNHLSDQAPRPQCQKLCGRQLNSRGHVNQDGVDAWVQLLDGFRVFLRTYACKYPPTLLRQVHRHALSNTRRAACDKSRLPCSTTHCAPSASAPADSAASGCYGCVKTVGRGRQRHHGRLSMGEEEAADRSGSDLLLGNIGQTEPMRCV